MGPRILAAAAVSAFLAALLWADIARRSYVAFSEGEKYLAWHRAPELRKAHWDAWLAAENARLERELAAGRIGAEERRWRGELAGVERDERVAESSLKYAVGWFETAVELLSAPPNPWSSRARERLAEARALWKAELSAQGVALEAFDPR